MYVSLTSKQIEFKRESKILVYDEARRRHLFRFNPLQLLLFVAGRIPFKLGDSYDTTAVGPVSVQPIKLIRDDLVTIYRTECEYSQDTFDVVVDYLSKTLTDNELAKVADYLQARVKGLDDDYDEILKDVQSLDLLNGSGGQFMKFKILETWFHHIFNGPASETRVLFFDDGIQGIRSDFEGPMMAEIYEQFKEIGEHDNNVGYVVLFDDKHYPIPIQSAVKMNFPDVVDLDYVEICGSTDYVEDYKEREIVSCCQVSGIYKIGIYQQSEGRGTPKHRLRLIAEDGLFDDMEAESKIMINSTAFNDWAQRNDLVLWAGRDEQHKLSDIREMRDKYLASEHENKKLKAMLQQYQK